MRICVFIRPVHNPVFPVASAPGKLPDGSLPSRLIPNPMDEIALETALSFRERLQPAPVTVTVCAAGSREITEPALREMIACGADRADWIEARDRFPDGEIIARYMQAYTRHRPFDLGLFGLFDSDTGSEQSGPMFSALTGTPFLAPAVEIVPEGSGAVRVTIQEGRKIDIVRSGFPVCLGILRGNPLRYPSLWGKQRAVHTEIDSFGDLFPEVPASKIDRVKLTGSKPKRGAGMGSYATESSADRMRQALGMAATPGAGRQDTLIRGTPESAAIRVVKLLKKEKILDDDPA